MENVRNNTENYRKAEEERHQNLRKYFTQLSLRKLRPKLLGKWIYGLGCLYQFLL